MLVYLDTSTFLKLVRSEAESPALRAELAASEAGRVSSALLIVEARRAADRYGAAASVRARAALGTVTLLPIDDALVERAAAVAPASLRSLDALHLAAALSLGDELSCMYCYDARLADGAAAAGIVVRRPA